MKAKIFIDQDEALKAGVDNFGEYIVEFGPSELTQAQRDELATCSADNGVYCTSRINSESGNFFKSRVPYSNLEALVSVIDARIAYKIKKEEEEKEAHKQKCQEEEAKIAKWISEPNGYILHKYRYSSAGWCETTIPDASNYIDRVTVPGWCEAVEDAESLLFWYTLDAKVNDAKNSRLKKERIEAIRKDKEAKEQRKADQIKAWVEVNGTENQKLRQKDGFLPDQEIIDEIRAEAYAPLDSFKRYDKLTKSDACEGDDEYGRHEVDFDVEDAEHLSANEYDWLIKIKEAVPNATIEPRIHTAKCDDCETEVTRIGFMVRITVGDFEFSREYGL